MRTLIGLFDSNEARLTISELQKLGAKPEDISVVAPAGTSQMGAGMQLAPLDVTGIGPVAACGPVSSYLTQATARSSADGIVAALVQMGVSDAEARRYVDGVREGYTLEAIRIDDDKATQGLEIMRGHSLGGGGGIEARRTGTARGAAGKERAGDEVLPVVVEELEVGKREVEAGGVRATSHVQAVPAEQDVTLRKESVDVERRPVDRPIADTDEAFRERTVEVNATSEEPIITKRARIIEEVVIHHNVGSETETIHETVRRTDVNVEPFEASHYQEHYEKQYGTSSEASEYDFSSYEPAYKFGSEMRTDSRFAGDEWSSVETPAKQTWEKKNPGTWDRFKDAIKHAWERAKA